MQWSGSKHAVDRIIPSLRDEPPFCPLSRHYVPGYYHFSPYGTGPSYPHFQAVPAWLPVEAWRRSRADLVAPHSGAVMAHSQAYGLMYGTLQQQAALWSYIDQFRLLAIVSLLLAPIIFLYRKSPSPPK